jgi:hypothetical protein
MGQHWKLSPSIAPTWSSRARLSGMAPGLCAGSFADEDTRSQVPYYSGQAGWGVDADDLSGSVEQLYV